MSFLLVLSTPGAADALKNALESARDTGRFESLNAHKQRIKVKAITSYKELAEFDFRKERVLQVLVETELDWPAENTEKILLGGYAAARQVLHALGEHPLHCPAIQFVAWDDRARLKQKTTGYEQLMVRMFRHYHRLDIDRIEAELMPRSKYQYFRNLCLVEAKLLAQLRHGLRNLLEQKDRNDPEHIRLKTRIEQILHFDTKLLGEDVVRKAGTLLHDLAARPGFFGSPEFNIAVDQLMRLLQEQEYKLSPQARREKKYPYKVLVVEDDANALNQLKRELDGFFDQVITCRNGKKALEIIRDEAPDGHLHGVFVDLELLEENDDLYQPVHGLDIIDYCRREHKRLVTRVVTALSRRGLRDLVGVEKSHILFKTGGGSILEANDNLAEIIDEMVNDIKKNQQNDPKKGPVRGAFEKGFFDMYYELKKEKPEHFGRLMQKARTTAETFVLHYSHASDYWNTPAHKIDVAFPSNRNIGQRAARRDEALFEMLMVHRHIMLAYAKYLDFDRFTYSFDEAEKRDQLRLHPAFLKPLPKAATTYFSTNLSMSIEVNRAGHCQIVQPNEDALFPEEKAWLDAYAPKLIETRRQLHRLLKAAKEQELDQLDTVFNHRLCGLIKKPDAALRLTAEEIAGIVEECLDLANRPIHKAAARFVEGVRDLLD